MTNPLPFDININNMKLIFQFISKKELQNDVESEKTNEIMNDKIENGEKELIYEEKNRNNKYCQRCAEKGNFSSVGGNVN